MALRYAFSNCTVHTGESVLHDKAVIVDGDGIEKIVGSNRIPAGLEVVDLEGFILAPGFIDLQVNGGGGFLFNDEPTIDCIRAICGAHRRLGTTGILVTLISTTLEKMLEAIEACREAMREAGQGVLGLHLEGPYISKDRKGVHDPAHIRAPGDEEIDVLLSRGIGVVRMMTVAPEVVSESQVRRIVESGIVVSAGHSNATYREAMEFFRWGGSCVTHLFNAMSQFGSREPGMIGASYDSETWAGIIADGFHVDFASVRISKREKGSKLFLVTDAMSPVGTEISSFRLGDREIYCEGGRCVTEEGKLAGSSLDMAKAVRNCVERVGIPLDEAIRMASIYPAGVLGMDKKLGMIAPGYAADLVVMDEALGVRGTVFRGEYEKRRR